MDFIYNRVFLEHETGMHPENKRRLLSLVNIKETEVEDGEKDLSLVHTPEHIEHVKQACSMGLSLDPDTLTSTGSFKAATYGVGAAIMASQMNGFALVRPPGHHAYANHASGFCLFNNIAIAAQKLVNEGKKVFILDFDGHLGDGTSDIFYKTDQVLYGSLHQYPAFPGKGWMNEAGEGKGKGFTIHIPLPPGSSDDLFMDGFHRILSVAEQFKPDMVGVSAGFDAHQYDPLLDLKVTMNTFYEIGKILSQEFDNIFAVLEGGYNTEVLPKCIFNFLDGINGKEMKYSEERTQSSEKVLKEYERRMGVLGN